MPVTDPKKRNAAVARRIRQTLPSAASFFQANCTSSVMLILKHGKGTRKRMEWIVAIDGECPEEVKTTIDSLFGPGGYVESKLKIAYGRRDNDNEETYNDSNDDL